MAGLSDGEATLRSIFRAAPIGVGLVVDRVLQKVNDRLCKMLGYSAEELVGQSARMVYPSDADYEYVGREKYAQIREHGVGTVETRWQRKDGRIIDVLLSSSPLDPTDLSAGVTFTALDITERKRAETALRVAEREKAAVLNAMSELVVYQDPEGRILWANRAAGESVGKKPEEMVGRRCFEIWHGRSDWCEGCPIARARQTGRPEEGVITSPDGRHWLIRGYPIYDERAGITGIVEVTQDITARKRAEEALRERDKWFRDIVDNAAEWIWEVDAEGRYTYASSAVERILGYKPKEVLQKHFYDFLHPDDRETLKNAAFASFARKVPFFKFLNHNVHRNGTSVWLLTSGVPVLDADGNLLGYRGLDTDITDRKRAEEALRAERDRAAMYLEVAEVAFIGIGADERVTLVNRKACGILGYTEAEIVGRNWFDHFLPERIREDTRSVFRRITAGDVAPVEYHENPILTKSGGERLIAWHNALLYDEAGKPALSLSSGVDITDRRQAETALRESEERYRCIVENSLDTIMLTRPDGVVTYLSPACGGVLGYAPEDLVGTVPDIFRPEDRPIVAEAFQSAMRGLSGSQIEYRVRTKEGSTKWISHSWSPVRDDGRLQMVVSVVRDITERKTAEEKQRQLEEQLRQAQKMEALGVLAAGVAHDLNNVMTAIMNYASLVHLAPSNEERVKEASERIRQAVDQATGLTRSLLTFSRRATMDKSPVHLGQTVLNSIALLRRMLPAAVEIVTDVSSSAPDLWIEADATQLQQVMMNLAVNARDAMPDGGKLHVSVAHRPVEASDVLSAVTTRGKGGAVLVVDDTGIGMNEEVQSRIFEPFFTTKPREQGTGLGMAVVHGIVSDHGGTIRVESEVGRGTRVEVAFPCCDPPGPDSRPSADDRAVRGHGETILVAEDNEVVLNLIASSLRSSGYRVVECGDGAEAMTAFKTHLARLGAVILDVDLPHKSGTTCLRDMRSACPELPAVVITGSVGPNLDDLVDAYTRGLYKPFLVTELIRLLNEVLGAGDRQTTSP